MRPTTAQLSIFAGVGATDSSGNFLLTKVLLESKVSYPDPDPAFHFSADPDLDPAPLMVLRIYDHWPVDPPGLHFETPRPYFELQWPSAVPCWASKDPKFRLYCGSWSSFQNNRDPDTKPCWCPRFFLPPSTDNFPGFVTSDVVDDHPPLWPLVPGLVTSN